MSAITSVAAMLRRIPADDNAAITRVIRKVSAEYGLITDRGYTAIDSNLDELFRVYSQSGAAYWVAKQNGEAAGGDGVTSLECSEPGIRELQEIYLLSNAHGQGLTKKLVLMAPEHAREQGSRQCYLETTASLTEVIHLYEHLGFEYINEVLGCTGHVGCEVRMLKPL